ncbi:MAG: DNA polymerase III subunit gamma/tau [Alphaproteobacteria bacterium]|nr:DNA polymerase III subunit gamma/tau [Alphaproteobacteria bacterium]
MAGQSPVLARKYRPQIFDDLIGQDALVRTITNAIQQNRLAQAYMLTGIRGIGKTTSARIIAKGLNCIGPDGKGDMTPNPCGKCPHCINIAADSDMDVIEIDAASNTGVDNVREIIEGAKYNPVSARFKFYIIDEVHMLTKAAFNALLKTLEEPPERVKFIFATTEIRKVPVTILSRCQRFDLKRIDTPVLAEYLGTICQKEQKKFSEEALQLIAKAGDGSVRDSLSLLDQAMTQLPNNPSIEDVRKMLGIADKSVLLDLYQNVLQGNMPPCFDLVNQQYANGADPLSIAQDLLELTHDLTTLKILPNSSPFQGATPSELQRLKDIATNASMQSLTAAWQMLLKGIQEIRTADKPFQALEMLLIRWAYLSEMPTPAQLLKSIKKNDIVPGASLSISTSSLTTSTSSIPEQKNSITFHDLKEIVETAQKAGERLLAYNISNYIHLIRIEPQKITCSFASDAPKNLSADLSKFLQKHTGDIWQIERLASGGEATLQEKKQAAQNQLYQTLEKTPLVSEIEQLFKGAKIQRIKPLQTDLSVEDEKQEDDS